MKIMSQAEEEVRRVKDQLVAAKERLRTQAEAHKIEVSKCIAKAQEAETKTAHAEDKVKSLSKRWREDKNFLVEQVHCVHLFTEYVK